MLLPYAEARDGLALWLLLFDGLCYGAFFGLAIGLPWYAKVAATVGLGVFISRYFILGHDAAHGSLFTAGRANAVAARLLFLPSYTPCSLWEIGHNTIHHGFTNLKGRDPVWTPLSPEEFRALAPWRQRLQRLYHTIPGLALYYGVELWWKKLYFPNREQVAVTRRAHAWDNGLVTLFFGLQVAAVWRLSSGLGEALVNGMFAVVLPNLLWWWFMGFAIFVHHRHPSVVWFTDRRQWSFQKGQLEGAVHMAVAPWFNRLAHQIFDHTAHHVDVRIPCYQLHAAQAQLENQFPEQVIHEEWSWRKLRTILRTCALYDYANRRWLPFDAA